MMQQGLSERRTEADSAPAVRYYQSEFGRIRIRAPHEASLSNDTRGFTCLRSLHLGDEADVLMLIGFCELVQ
jgi:hypothetical protein